MCENKKVSVITLGCKVNQYESEALSEALCKEGYEVCRSDDLCFAYIINTCTVTSESDRKARQLIRRALSNNPEAFILVTGCYSQTNPRAIANIAGVDYICGSSNKLSCIDKLKELELKGEKNKSSEINIPDVSVAEFETMSISHFDRTRAYVKIQDGCESKCTYCAIPSARGRVRSKPFADILKEVSELSDAGCREIVLTGIETGAYGRDLSQDENLASLLCEIDKIENIGRIRLGSLDPFVIKPSFAEKISSLKCIAHHFHLSVQSGSDRILSLMKRKYNSEQALKAIKLLRSYFPDLQLTTDIIVGFPSESEDDFRKTAEFVKEAGFLTVHVFPYSKRAGTPAAIMNDQIDDTIKHERVSVLLEISRNLRKDILHSYVDSGAVSEVLFESADGGYMYGHNSQFIEIRVKTDRDLHAEIHNVKIISENGEYCEGILL